MPRKKQHPVEPEDEGLGLAAYELQKSVVARLSKSALPDNVKLQKEVPLALVKGSTVFISYLAALAHDTATERNHKTINATHVLDAAKQLGWDDGDELHKALKKELAAYRHNNELRKKGMLPPKQPAKSKASTSASTSAAASSTTTTSGEGAPAGAAGEGEQSTGTDGATLIPNDGPEDVYPEAAEDEDNTGLEEYVMSAEEEDEDMDAASEGMVEEEVADPVGLEGDGEYRDE
ncbi:hypothetical protein JCM11251_007133 [Rhodosporidiobolus azoricus]